MEEAPYVAFNNGDEVLHAISSDAAAEELELDKRKLAATEMHEMLLYVCFFFAERKPTNTHAALAYGCIKYNPFYWFAWVVGAFCIWIGCWFHMPCGQDHKTRPDETEQERCLDSIM